MMKDVDPRDLDKKGKEAFKKKHYADAALLFQSAAQAYATTNDIVNAAEMANNWSVAALKAGDGEAALNAADGTPEIFADAGDQLREGMAYGNIGAAYEALGKFDEAMFAYEKSAELLKEAGEHDTRLHVMQALSALQLRTGKQLQALATMQAGLEGVSTRSPKQKFLKKLLDLPTRYMTGE
jgi:tetratricopeptide (TPR) repeat protein